MPDTVTARLALSRRVGDVVIIVGAAVAASAAIALWYDRPLTIAVTCAAILVALLVRFHEPRDLVGLVVGATVGNAVELACDAAGIWQHADRAVLNLAPAYILLCYPILGLATPRLIDALAGAGRARRELAGSVAPLAAGLLLLFVVLSMQFGRDASMQSLVCAVCLALTLWRFHSRHDLITAFAGALIALAWEVPATIAGAWSFPTPQVFGLLPAWLPAAYAVFFVTMGRLTAVLAGRMTGLLILRQDGLLPSQRRRTPAPAMAAWPRQTRDTARSRVAPAALHTRVQNLRRPPAPPTAGGTEQPQTHLHPVPSGPR